MKKFDLKSIIIGALIGIISFSFIFYIVDKNKVHLHDKEIKSSILAQNTQSNDSAKNSNNISAGEKIAHAEFNNSKVYFNGEEISLKKPLITITSDDNSESQLYIPADEILEYMNFNVNWNKKDNGLYLTMGQYNGEKSEFLYDTPEGETDIDNKAIDIIQETGNWTYIEPYLPYMSNEGIKNVVDIYNSKHMDVSEHKNASDYITRLVQ